MKSFTERAYSLVKRVPFGKVTTYKEIAHALNTKAYRAVGNAMRNNPYAPEIPCHRVVASDGSIGGFKGEKAGKPIKEKVELLKKEGIVFKGKKIQDFEQRLWRFKE